MARIARIVIPGVPYHLIGNGNHGQNIFLCDSDKMLYLKLLDEYGEKFGVSFLAYCLMNTHYHAQAIPESETSFAKCFAEVNRRYTTIINTREGWRGTMWQGRFKSFPMDDAYLFNTVKYSERNPVKAGIVKKAWEYQWSSAAEHVFKKPVSVLRLIDPKKYIDVSDWKAYLEKDDPPDLHDQIEFHGRTGRPLGSRGFIDRLEKISGRILAARNSGRNNELRASTMNIIKKRK